LETPVPTCIIAYVGDGERYKPVEDVATATAKRSAAQLILYDADAASRWTSPVPNWWSGEGSADLLGNRLTPEQLESLGRKDFAAVVRLARVEGVDAYAWLPSARGAKDLATYAAKVGADLLILPADLEDIGLFDRLKGENTPGEVEKQAHITVMTVELAPAAGS
jgi:hypothetical protein